MTDVIYERGVAREAAIWGVFQYNGPFSSEQSDNRTTIFGLYANTYLHGHNYLSEIEAEDLQKLVDAYNANIAKLTNDEAMLVLEIAAKRYEETIKNQIHADQMETYQDKIDALNDEYDAKLAALDADQAAINTMIKRISIQQQKMNQRVRELEIQEQTEEANQSMADLEVTREELRSARADLELIESGLRALDIQLAITNTRIDYSNTELQITEAENEEEEIDLRTTETGIQEAGVDVDITNQGVALSRAASEGERIKTDTRGVEVRTADTKYKIAKTEAEETQYDLDLAKIEVDELELDYVDTEKKLIDADLTVIKDENENLLKERWLIDNTKENVQDEERVVDNQGTELSVLNANRLLHEEAKGTAETGMISSKTLADDAIKNMKVQNMTVLKDMADKEKSIKVEEAQDRAGLNLERRRAAWDKAEAAIDYAQQIADMDIINTLTHSVKNG